ncbi:hypothetical protein [Acidiferrobacter sp.]|uniref:hypothetical protein n=1 Tax=Acidiferrobacter sp. TaxID=1872107 RepID=UPI002629BBAC|nr:hypothetical protein [Acidiferrobacter sp.]
MAKLSMADREAIISLEVVREGVAELEALARAKDDAAELFGAGVEAVAVKAGLEPAVLKRYVTARVQDKTQKLAQQAAQLQLLFDEFGRDA